MDLSDAGNSRLLNAAAGALAVGFLIGALAFLPVVLAIQVAMATTTAVTAATLTLIGHRETVALAYLAAIWIPLTAGYAVAGLLP